METKAVITSDGKLIAQVPKDIPPGECQVVVVIEEDRSDAEKLEQLRRDVAMGIEQADRGEVVNGKEAFEQIRVRNQQARKAHS